MNIDTIFERFDEVQNAMVARDGKQYYMAVKILITLNLATQISGLDMNVAYQSLLVSARKLLEELNSMVVKTPKHKKLLEENSRIIDLFELATTLDDEPVPEKVFISLRNMVGAALTDYLFLLNRDRERKFTKEQLIADTDMFLKLIR